MKKTLYLMQVTSLFTFLLVSNPGYSQQNFWQPINNGLTNKIVAAFAFHSSGVIFAGTVGGGVFRSNDNGDAWSPSNSGFTTLQAFALAINESSGIIFAGSSAQGGGVYRSSDNGDNWVQINNGLSNTLVEVLVINSSGDVFAGTENGGVYRSSDHGDSWSPINTDLKNTQILTLAINSGGDVFAGTVGGAFRSNDNGDTWSPINGITDIPVSAFAFHSSGNIFAGTGGSAGNGRGVFRSNDNGNSWSPINSGLANDRVLVLVINSRGDLFAGTVDGAFRSSDNGDTWSPINTGLTNTYIVALVISGGGTIFAGTAGGGAFRSVQPTTAVEEISTRNPSSFALEQNYPNPFNPETTIRYDLPAREHIRLIIFDVLGQTVRTLVEQKQSAGIHSVTWNGRDDGGRPLASGLFFYRLEAGEFRKVAKMLMIK